MQYEWTNKDDYITAETNVAYAIVALYPGSLNWAYSVYYWGSEEVVLGDTGFSTQEEAMTEGEYGLEMLTTGEDPVGYML